MNKPAETAEEMPKPRRAPDAAEKAAIERALGRVAARAPRAIRTSRSCTSRGNDAAAPMPIAYVPGGRSAPTSRRDFLPDASSVSGSASSGSPIMSPSTTLMAAPATQGPTRFASSHQTLSFATSSTASATGCSESSQKSWIRTRSRTCALARSVIVTAGAG